MIAIKGRARMNGSVQQTQDLEASFEGYKYKLTPHTHWNGYLRKGQKTMPKRQNRTRNGKAWKRQSQDKAQV
ncbi:hypothetical protein Tco_1065304 [Tanacetum coccineum]